MRVLLTGATGLLGGAVVFFGVTGATQIAASGSFNLGFMTPRYLIIVLERIFETIN